MDINKQIHAIVKDLKNKVKKRETSRIQRKTSENMKLWMENNRLVGR